MIEAARFVADRPVLVLSLGCLVTAGLAALAVEAGLERRAADACAYALLATVALTGGVFAWIFAHVRKARPTTEEQLINEVLDELEMEEQLNANPAPEARTPRDPWEKPADWWKEEER